MWIPERPPAQLGSRAHPGPITVFEANTVLLLVSVSQRLAPNKPGKIILSAAPTVPQRVSKTEGGWADFFFFSNKKVKTVTKIANLLTK